MVEVSSLQVVINAETAGLEAGLSRASRSVSGFSSSMQQGLGMGAGFAAMTVGISAITAAFSGAQGAVIGLNSKLEQAQIGFTSMLGSAEKASGFLRDLQAFAAKTPFAFPELITASQRMLAYGFAASEVKPLLVAVGSAASAMGGGAEGVQRITNALGQMRAATVVQLGELNQLTEAGVPAFNILADAMGKTTGEVKKLVSEGKIASDVFINAFQAWAKANFGDMMEKQAKTFEGAMSTIKDVISMTAANAFKPLFEAISAGAVALSEFLQGDNFQTWAVAIQVGFQSAITWVGSFLSALAPLGEAIATAFGQFTSGDFAGAFATVGTAIEQTFTNAVATVQAFATEMFGAGVSLVGELAGGIVDGAGSLLTAAVNTVAEVIASFLIGNSPPAQGPLAQIGEGGAATIRAWGEGAVGAVQSAVAPVVQAVAGNMDQLKDAGRGADDAIRNIGRSMQDLDSQSRDLKNAAEDVKQVYDDQIKALDDQIKAIDKAAEGTREREKLEMSLEEHMLKQAEVAAMGDPVLRAQLRTRLDSLKAQQSERKNAEALQDAELAISGTRKDQLKDQQEAMKFSQQEADLRDRLKKAKDPAERERIQAQLKELEIRKQIGAEEDQERQKAAARRIADAKAKKEELVIEQQLEGMTDKEALARAKSEQATLRARQEALAFEEKRAKLEAALATGPLKDERERLIAERDGALKPLQAQMEVISRQKEALTEQRQAWQAIKQDIGDATKAAKEQAAATAAALKPAIDRTAYTPDALAEAAVAKAKEAGAKLAAGIGEGFSAWMSANFLTVVAGSIGAVFGGNLGAAIGGVIAGPLGAVFGGAIGAGIGAISGSQLFGMLQAKIEEIIGGPLNVAVKAKMDAIMQTIRDALGTIASVFARDWSPSGSIDPLVNSLGKIAIVVRDQVMPAVTEFGRALMAAGKFLLEHKEIVLAAVAAFATFKVLTTVVGLVTGLIAVWGAASAAITAAGGVIATIIAVLGGPLTVAILAVSAAVGLLILAWVNNWGGIQEKTAAVWAAIEPTFTAMVDWLGVQIPRVLDWIALVGWPAMLEAGRLVADWITTTAIPALTLLVDWLGPKISTVTTWISDTGWPALVTAGTAVGVMVQSVIQFFTDLYVELEKRGVFTELGTIWETLTGIGDKLWTLLGKLWEVVVIVGTKFDELKTAAIALVTSALEPLLPQFQGVMDKAGAAVKPVELVAAAIDTFFKLISSQLKVLETFLRLLDRLSSIKVPSFNFGPTGAPGSGGEGQPMSFPSVPVGGGEIEAYIRQAATLRGIDPDTAIRVALSEGGLTDPVAQSNVITSSGQRERSYGPYQLYMDGGLGNAALNQGIDPRNPAQWREAVDFALNQAAKSGWGAWHGAKRVGIEDFQGIPTGRGQTGQEMPRIPLNGAPGGDPSQWPGYMHQVVEAAPGYLATLQMVNRDGIMVFESVAAAGTTAGANLVSASTDSLGNVTRIYSENGVAIGATITDTAGQIVNSWGAMGAAVVASTATTNLAVGEANAQLGTRLIEETTIANGITLAKYQEQSGAIVTIVTGQNGQILADYTLAAEQIGLVTDLLHTTYLTSTTDALGMTTEIWREKTGEITTIVTDSSGQIVEEFTSVGKAAVGTALPLSQYKTNIENIPELNLKSSVSELNAMARAADKATQAIIDLVEASEDLPGSGGGSKSSSKKGADRRAVGGPVIGGQMYMVGEQGPEMFYAPSSGNIIPNHRLGDGGGGDTITVNITVQGSLVYENDLEQTIGNAVVGYLRHGAPLGSR